MNLKKAILTLTLFSFIFNLWGQEPTSKITHKRIELELSVIAAEYLFITPAIGYATNRHAIYIAPNPPPQSFFRWKSKL